MESRTQDPAGYHVWEVPGQPVIVQIRLDVVDRLAAEVMRGFGAVPKRGAEVGGVLIGTRRGTARPDAPAIVRVDDFEAVPCEYRRGPSYLFTEEDGRDFEDCWNRLQPGTTPSAYAVGYFRSHTRDGFSLEGEDLELLDQFFPGPTAVALLIKPYATRVSMGAFFAREHGVFPEKSPQEFPLRRRELLGEEAPARRPLTEGRRGERRPRAAEENPQTAFGFSEPARETLPVSAPVRSWRGWVWLPLTFLFLLLGVALGYQLAQTMGARAAAAAAQDLSLALSVKRNDDNLSVTWNRFAPSVRAAQKGLLEIDDGGYTKPVSLDAAQLQNGSLIYHNATNAVRFRLTVYPQARVSVVETFEWKQ
jgi:hypothetical protein